MRNFVEAYAAVHNNEAKEELTSSRDCISEMNLSDLTDTDLDEIVEQVLEVMFSQGYSVDSAHLVFSEAFEESSIAGRQQKIERLCEALNRAFDLIDSKASTVALEEFAKYRNNKKLQESWSARFNQEKRIQRAHDRLVAAESLNVKTQLLKIVEKADKSYLETDLNKRKKNNEAAVEDMKKMGSMKNPAFEEVSQIRKSWGDAYRSIYADKETISEKGMNPGFKAYLEKQKAKKNEDGDEGKSSEGGGKPDFLDLDKDGNKKEPMKKASKEMKKEEVETIAEKGPVTGQRPPGRSAARRQQLRDRGVPDPGTEKQEVINDEVSQIRKSWGDAYRSIYEKKLDPVAKNPANRDGDVNNDNRKDDTDSYIYNRRDAIAKAMKKKGSEQVDEGIADRAKKAVGHQRQGTHGDAHELDNLQKAADSSRDRMNKRMGADAAGKRSEMDVRRRFPKNEGVEFSEAELKAFEAIVNSWED